MFGCPERIRTLESKDAWQTLGLPSAAASPKKSLFNEIRAPDRKPPLRSKAEIKDSKKVPTGRAARKLFRIDRSGHSASLLREIHRFVVVILVSARN